MPRAMLTARSKVATPAARLPDPGLVPTSCSSPLYKESPGTSGRIAALTSAKPGMLDRRMSKVAKKAAASAPTPLAGTSPAPTAAVAVYPAQPSRPMTVASAMVARSAYAHTAKLAQITAAPRNCAPKRPKLDWIR